MTFSAVNYNLVRQITLVSRCVIYSCWRRCKKLYSANMLKVCYQCTVMMSSILSYYLCFVLTLFHITKSVFCCRRHANAKFTTWH